mgnify:CR=1 FL=1
MTEQHDAVVGDMNSEESEGQCPVSAGRPQHPTEGAGNRVWWHSTSRPSPATSTRR